MAQNSHKGCVLITGAGGKLGRLLRAARRALPDLQHDYVFQSRGSGADVQWSPGDSLAPLPRCTAVIALWGATSGDEAALAQNSLLVAQSRDLAQALRATRLMHLSSAAVYGPGQNMNEDHATNPQNNYGKSKLEMETAVEEKRHTHDLTHICLRLANVVGADSLAPALRGERPARIDDFSVDPNQHQGPRRSYIGAKGLLTVLDALLSLPAATWPDHLNIASQTPVFMNELITASGHSVIWQPAPATATSDVTLDVSRLQTLLPHIAMAAKAADLIAEWRHLESLA